MIESAFKYLESIKKTHSKVKHIVYKSLKIADYLIDASIQIDLKILLFRLRTSMINVKCNFKSNYEDSSCDLCDINLSQNQNHLLECDTIINNCPQLYENRDSLYSDLFMEVKKQVKVAKLFKEVLKTKLKLEESD